MTLLEDFFTAIVDNDVNQVGSLIAIGAIDVNARLPRLLNPPALVFAAQHGRADIVKTLLSAGADIDDTDNDGETACHGAVNAGHVDVLALLLAHRPNLCLKDSKDHTPIQSLFSKSFVLNPVIALMLIEAGAPLEGFSRVALCEFALTSTSAIQSLMKRDIAVSEFRDVFDRTALHMAALRSGEVDSAVLQMLVDVCGVDLEARSKFGATCTHTAAMHDKIDALRCFIAAGANVRTADNEHQTPLHFAGNLDCTIMLLAAGADVHALDQWGSTACHFAAEENRLSIVHALLAAGADLDIEDENGDTVRQLLSDDGLVVDAEQIAAAQRAIAKARLDFVRYRALQVCIGLQSRGLDALQMTEILLHSCGPVAPLIAFHQWWKIATIVKHFNRN
jgi:ankyrin repeat protein